MKKVNQKGREAIESFARSHLRAGELITSREIAAMVEEVEDRLIEGQQPIVEFEAWQTWSGQPERLWLEDDCLDGDGRYRAAVYTALDGTKVQLTRPADQLLDDQSLIAEALDEAERRGLARSELASRIEIQLVGSES